MADEKLSGQLDQYFDRTRKNISQWLAAYSSADMRIVNGNKINPSKKALQDIYDYALLDAHLSAVVEQRKSKVLSEEFAIFNGEEILTEKTKLLNKKWFSKLQEAIIDARFYGYNLIEIQELVDREINQIKVINRGNVIPERNAIAKHPFQTQDANLIFLDQRNDKDYYILIDGEKGHGLLNAIVPLCIMKRITIAYWSEHSMQFGIPPTILKTDNKDQVNKFHEDLNKFVHARKIIIGTDDSLEVLQQTQGDPHNIYKELIEVCNTEISKAIIGQTMTTEDGSSRSQSEVHERVAIEIADADKEFMLYTINDIVLPKLIALGYPFEGTVFKYNSKEKRSYQEKLNTIEILSKGKYKGDPEGIKLYLDLPFDITISSEPVEPQEEIKSQVQKKSLIQNEIEAYYKEVYIHDEHDVVAIDDEFENSLQPIIDQIILDVYSGIDTLSPKYIEKVGELFADAVLRQFNLTEFDNPDFDSTDIEFFQSLQQNIYHFATGKNKTILKSFQELLIDENGEVRSFSAFKRQATKVGLQFNKHHLRTEYNTAILNSQNARDWRSFDDDDMLLFSAVIDGRTAPLDRSLNGIIRPKKDTFWNYASPQLHWGCRCRLIVTNDPATTMTAKQKREIKNQVPEEFRFNAAKDGILFPKDHPYIKILSEDDKKQAEGFVK